MISKNRLKYLASLRVKKYRDAESRFLIEGLRLCEQAINSLYRLEELYFDPNQVQTPRAQRLIENARKQGIAVFEIPANSLKRLTETVHSQGVAGLVVRKHWHIETEIKKPHRLIIALDRLADPGNAGTTIRTAAWFGADMILLGQNSVELTNPKTVRATMGALFQLPVVENVDLGQSLNELKRRGFQVVVAAANGNDPISGMNFRKSTVLVFGSEARGVAEELRNLADITVSIPRYGGHGESLNVAVAAGIIMAALARSRES